MPEQPFIPNGTPLDRAELLKLAEFSQAELDKAIGSANRRLKPYLLAKPYERK